MKHILYSNYFWENDENGRNAYDYARQYLFDEYAEVEGCMEIETETLKAIKIDESQIILAAVGGGQNTPEKMKRYIKRYGNARPGTFGRRQAERMKKALPYMEKIKWN